VDVDVDVAADGNRITPTGDGDGDAIGTRPGSDIRRIVGFLVRTLIPSVITNETVRAVNTSGRTTLFVW